MLNYRDGEEMMEKVREFIKRHKVETICAVVVVLVILVGLVVVLANSGAAKVTVLERENYSLRYDTGWKLAKETEDEVTLKRGSEGEIVIQISQLAEEYRFLAIGDFVNEIMQSIQEQNTGYNLLAAEPVKLTKDQYEGYKLLYENGDEQVMAALYKKGGRLVVIRYEADNAYFDILLDSVNSVIYNFEVKDEKFSLGESLRLDLGEVGYGEDGGVDAELGEVRTYEIAQHNYLVKYALPAAFRQTSWDSTTGYFKFEAGEGRMNIVVDIMNRNIYEYLSQEEKYSIYQDYKSYRENGDYAEFQETLAKRDGGDDAYIYKNSYYTEATKFTSSGAEKYQRLDENAELVYALSNMQTLSIKIESKGLPVTRKLVDMIKVESAENYASYIKVEKEAGKLVGRLQRFADYNYETVDVVTIKVPEKYAEIDKGGNIYADRYYGWGYDEEMDFYGYEVHYGLSTLPAESIIKTINDVYITSTYGEAHKLAYAGELTLDGKKFKLYTGGYTDISGIMFTSVNRKLYYVNKSVLVYEIPDKGTLYIEVSGNGKEVTKEVLGELVDFAIEEKKI